MVETLRHISIFDKCITHKLSNVFKFKMLGYVTEFSSELCMLKFQYQRYQSRRHTSI